MRGKLNRRDFLRVSASTAAVAFIAACSAAPQAGGTGASGPTQEGVVIRYAGLDTMGARVEEFLQPWLEETGNKLERGVVGQQELTDKIMQAVATNTPLADVVQFPSNARGDVIAAGALLPVPEDVLQAIEIDDVLPNI